MMHPSESTRLCCTRLYLERAKEALAEAGGTYIPSRVELKVAAFEESIPNKIQNKLGIVADVNLLNEGELEYIEIVVNPWSFPVNYDREYLYRSGSTKCIGGKRYGYWQDQYRLDM